MGLHLPQFARAAAIVPRAGSGADTINLTADITLAAKPASQQPAQQPAQPAYMQLHNCMATLTRILNFRKTPGGMVIGHVPYGAHLPAVERPRDWFKADYWVRRGGISADYVPPVGDCGCRMPPTARFCRGEAVARPI